MNLSAINRAIEALCSEEPMTAPMRSRWRSCTENELFFDVALCILSSQTLFELALATAESLKRVGLLEASACRRWGIHYEEALSLTLAKPVRLEGQRAAMPRFRNRVAKLIATTAKRIYGEGKTLQALLASANSAADARRNLVTAIAGFGPKQASLYLRRIGYCVDLAVLDTHILDYLKLIGSMEPKPGALSRLSTYEQVEREFQRIAESFGHPVGCVDLAMWVTMRVAKRGSFA